ncbi:hypothetical protein D3C73_1279330 [compost metagenome]
MHGKQHAIHRYQRGGKAAGIVLIQVVGFGGHKVLTMMCNAAKCTSPVSVGKVRFFSIDYQLISARSKILYFMLA